MPYRPVTQEELPLLVEIGERAFRFDASQMREQLANDSFRYNRTHGRVWEEEARGVVASMWLFERDITVGGHELAAGLIGMVGVPAEHRRRGYANKMMRGALQEMRERELPLSLLFPYSIPFYNRLGYGVASYVWSIEFPLEELRDFDEMRRVRRMTPEDMPAMQRLYERVRLRHNGWMERTEWEWRERVLDLPGNADWPQKVEGVVVPGEGDELDGYLTYTIADVEGATIASKARSVLVQEWVSDGDEAWRALAGFVAAQRAQAKFMRYTAPEGFPLLHALHERNTFRDRRNVEFAFRDTLSMGAGLMGRIVHLEKALRQRGYPAHVSGECVVQMRDEQLPANEEPLHLNIGDGRANVMPAQELQGTRAPIATADARTWAELYTATLTPGDARTLGRLDADDATVDFLSQAFRGEPWFIHRADWF
ncbi:MAG: GNAT family N-acetyltransferase [Chloroflexota bacterium]|nr:GNAT family N-acetyltransferase [Chloroflexota bacterium]